MRSFKIKIDNQEYLVEVEEVTSSDQQSTPVVKNIQKSEPVVEQKVVSEPKGDGVELTAPMPGTIIKFNVADGDSVKKGDSVCILEAMKMENEIVANADGKIKLAVGKGTAVENGTVLAYIS